MASFCMNSLPLPPPSSSQPGKLSCLTHGGAGAGEGPLKPIVLNGIPPTFVSSQGRRIVAVGDLHGDLTQTRFALEMAGVLSTDGNNVWTGEETVLIQLGDILDRGEDEIAILSLLQSLNIQAKSKGGAVFQLNGNHETMNVEGDFRYVEPGAFNECANFLEYLVDNDYNWDEAFISWISVTDRWKEDRKASHDYWGTWNLVKDQTTWKVLPKERREAMYHFDPPASPKLAYSSRSISSWHHCIGHPIRKVLYKIVTMNNLPVDTGPISH